MILPRKAVCREETAKRNRNAGPPAAAPPQPEDRHNPESRCPAS